MKLLRLIILNCSLLMLAHKAIAYDSTLVNALVKRLEQLQNKTEGSFPKGMFPSYREYVKNQGRLRDDDNIFYTGLVIYTLNSMRAKLSEANKVIADSIAQRAKPVFAKFKNRKGQQTYNFWQTDTLVVFPNSGWINWFNKSHALPDDMDDTAISLMALNADSATVSAVHVYMQQFANSPEKHINNTFKKYRNMPAYSVWFGKKFPVDFDICVLSNVLTMVSTYNLPWTKADSASLELISKVIEADEHITDPGYIAPHYSTTPNILYHVSRLMKADPTVLLAHKQKLVDEAIYQYHASKNIVEKAMLATALQHWNVAEPIEEKQVIKGGLNEVIEDNNFVFFIANMASMLPDTFKKTVGNWGIGKFNYYCPAYNVALVLEYAVGKGSEW